VRPRTLIIPLVALIVLILDQASKDIVTTRFELNQPWYPISFLRPLFSITYIQNTGAAFGILQNQNLFFTIVAIVVIAVILVYVRTTPQTDPLIALSLGLQLGGAGGNLIDRLHQGYVTDFLYVQHYAISNIADVCISVGVALLAFQLLFHTPSATQSRPAPAAGSAAPAPDDTLPKSDAP
jgi:signal peptidase II